MAIKYKWLAGILRDMAEKNRKKGENRFPTEQELCRRYRLSRQTVRQALNLLENEGVIEKRQGSGTFLTGHSSSASRIGILISSEQEYIYPRVLTDIRLELESCGFESTVYVTGNQTCTERRILKKLIDLPPRGIIVEGCKSALPNPNLDLYIRLLKLGTAVVFLFSYYSGIKECIYISDANQTGSAQLVRHLIENGHSSIGGIFKSDDIQGLQRYQGYCEALKTGGLEIPDEHIGWFNSDNLKELLYEKNSDFLKKTALRYLSSCTAVVCYNDLIAYHLIQELHFAGYHIPEDIAVASFDNTYLSTSGTPTITSLSHRPHEMGKRAAQALLEQIRGLPTSPQEIPWKLNIRESTALTLS